VIGTGISGTAAMKAAQEEGYDFVAFEKQEDVGGFWRYKPDLQYPSVYESTHICSKRDHNSFGTVPHGSKEPQVLNNTEVVQYLRHNHTECDLKKHIKLNHEVTWITDAKDDNKMTGLKRWKVDYVDASGLKFSEVFDGVMICSGRHSRPRLPRFEGMDLFKGMQIHSSRYKSPEIHGLEGKRVVVIGVGNSGNDIISEAAPVSEHLWIVARRGTWLVETKGEASKFLAEDRLLSGLSLQLPWQMTTRIVEARAFKNQDLVNDIGLRPDHHFMAAHPAATGVARGTREQRGANGVKVRKDSPTIHDSIRAGKITGKRGLARLTEDSVIFTDGEEVKVDVIIYATGFKQAIEFLDPEIVDMRYSREGGEVADKLYHYVFPMKPACASLGFIAFCQSITFMCAEVQSRLHAGVVSGRVKLESVEAQKQEMAAFDASLKAQFNDSPRHLVQGATRMEYYDKLAKMQGCYPSFLKLLFERPTAFWHAYFTPWTALTYRLVGPGRQADAEKLIEEQFETTKQSLGHGIKLRTASGWPNMDYWKQVVQVSLMLMQTKLRGFDSSAYPRPDYLAPESEHDLTTVEAMANVSGSRHEQVAGQATISNNGDHQSLGPSSSL